MSERFASLLILPGATSIGWHVIKGFVEPIQLFAWIDPSSARREPPRIEQKAAWISLQI